MIDVDGDYIEATAPSTPGEFLRQILDRRRISARKLADDLGCHPQTIYNITAGGVISADMALKLNDKFGYGIAFWRQETLEEFEETEPQVKKGARADKGAHDASEQTTIAPQSESADPGYLQNIGFLADRQIREALKQEGSGLVIKPDHKNAIQPNSYDLRRGVVITKGYKELDRYEWRKAHAKIYGHRGGTNRSDEQGGGGLEALSIEDDFEERFDSLVESGAIAYTFDVPEILEDEHYVHVLTDEWLDFGIDFTAIVGEVTGNALDGLEVKCGTLVDPGYRGPLLFRVRNQSGGRLTLEAGQKLATLLISRQINEPTHGYRRDIDAGSPEELAEMICKELVEDTFVIKPVKKREKIEYDGRFLGTADSRDDAEKQAIRWMLQILLNDDDNEWPELHKAFEDSMQCVEFDETATEQICDFFHVQDDIRNRANAPFGPKGTRITNASAVFELLPGNKVENMRKFTKNWLEL